MSTRPINTLPLQRGVTLVELIISIVVIGIAMSGLLVIMTVSAGKSADPLLQQQAGALAEAYLEEILLKPYSGAGGATRDSYDNIWDYDGLNDAPPQDQFGTPLAQLAAYTVAVSVADSAALSGMAAGDLARVTVTVTHHSGLSFTLSGYRANY